MPSASSNLGLRDAALLGVVLLAVATGAADTPPASDALALAARAALADAGEVRAVGGRDGWLFLASELRHLQHGDFWGAAASTAVARADPEPALLRLHRELGSLGIALVLVPVPAKAAIYPDRLADVAPPTAPLDHADRRFAERLRGQGLTVVDLDAPLIAGRAADDAQGPVYCAGDSHWSPRGAAIAARAVAAAGVGAPWRAALPSVAIAASAPQPLTLRGDLRAADLRAADGASETLPLRRVARADGGAVLAADAPVLVLGDSHTLVFSDGGDLFASGAGFPELLAVELRCPVERLGIRGSAAGPFCCSPLFAIGAAAAR